MSITSPAQRVVTAHHRRKKLRLGERHNQSLLFKTYQPIINESTRMQEPGEEGGAMKYVFWV